MLRTAWTDIELLAAKPPEKLSVSEWACKYRELGRLSAITGLYSLEMTPFFGPIMDRCADQDVDEQSLCACAQIGKTVAVVENVVGYYLHQDPSSVMVVLADEDTTKFVSLEKISKMFRDSPSLSNLHRDNKFNQKTIDTPNGGHVDFGWASSVAKIATRPERIVIGDEINKPGYHVKSQEASALSLMRERTKSYPAGYYKHIFCSTPTNELGNITVLSESADACLDWHVPCPYCGQYQPLRWSPDYCHGFKDGVYRGDDGGRHNFGKVVWDGGRDATREQINKTARYKCGECGELWNTYQRNEAVRNGKEVSREKVAGKPRKYWNHINRIYSLFDSGRLENLVSAWVDIFKLPKERQIKELQGFVNSALAEPFKISVKTSAGSEAKVLLARVDLDPQVVPEEAVALTCYIDVQKYGFWFAVRAFASNYTSWGIHYGYLTSWDAVKELLFDTIYPVHGSSRGMRIWRAGIDTGGGGKYENVSMVEETYHNIRLFQETYGRNRVWGTKGASTPIPGHDTSKMGKRIPKTPSGKPLPGGVGLRLLDTHKLKNIFHTRLRHAIERKQERPAYLHKKVNEDYAKQILAEELRVDENGNEYWKQVGADNHYLDCECGCIALAEPEWEGGGVNLIKVRVSDAPQKKGRRVLSRGIDAQK